MKSTDELYKIAEEIHKKASVPFFNSKMSELSVEEGDVVLGIIDSFIDDEEEAKRNILDNTIEIGSQQKKDLMILLSELLEDLTTSEYKDILEVCLKITERREKR